MKLDFLIQLPVLLLHVKLPVLYYLYVILPVLLLPVLY